MQSKPNGRTQFEKLDVYRLSEKLADEIWTAVTAWERFAKQTVGTQVVRSADSIGANIAEGAGRGSFQDNRRFVRTARGSLNETKHWLRRAHSRHLLTPDTVDRIKPLIDALGPKLNAYLRSIGPVPGGSKIDVSMRRTTDDGPRTTNNGRLTTDD
jgi:four helix bundle protein